MFRMDKEENKDEAQHVKDQVDESNQDDLDEVLYMFCELAWPTRRSQDQ